MFFSDVDEVVHNSQAIEVGEVSGESHQLRVVFTSKSKCEFKVPSKDDDIVGLSKKKFAPESQRKMKWVITVVKDWRLNRINSGQVSDEIVETNLEDVPNLSEPKLAYSLSRFVWEVKKIDGSEYPPNILC